MGKLCQLHRKMQKNRKTANNKVEKIPKTKKERTKTNYPSLKADHLIVILGF